MIFKQIQGLFSHDLLIELRESKLTVRAFSNNNTFEMLPIVAVETSNGKETVRMIGGEAANAAGPNVTRVTPFAHSRSMISNFAYAELVLQHAIRKMHSGALRPSPRVVMHQLEKNEGGLTDIESRVLTELAYGGGARDVIVYTGPPINVNVETYDSIKSRITT